jgi:hypothetical protein
MEKRKITAREILKDIRGGMDDALLMRKYQLSAQGLQSVFNKMVQAGVVTEEELDGRVPLSARTVDIGLFICPACGNIQGSEFIECPRCGYVPPGQVKKSKALRTSPGKSKAQSSSRPAAQAGGKSVGGESPVSSSVSSVSSSVSSVASISSRALEAPDAPQLSRTTKDGLRSITKYFRVLGIVALVAYVMVALGLIAAMWLSVSQGLLTVAQSLLGALILGSPAIITGAAIFVMLRALAASMLILQKISDQGESSGVDQQ